MANTATVKKPAAKKDDKARKPKGRLLAETTKVEQNVVLTTDSKTFVAIIKSLKNAKRRRAKAVYNKFRSLI